MSAGASGVRASAGGNMEIRELTEDEILPIILGEYKKDFPKNQRKSDRDLMRIIALDIYDVWGIFEDGKRVGYFFGYKAKNGKTLLLDYFAITSSKRGNKLGTRALEMLDTAPVFKKFDSFLGELDDPRYIWFNRAHKERAIRKLAFFKRMGFIETGVETCEFGVKMIVVRKVKEGKKVTHGADFKAELDQINQELYGKRVKRIRTKLVK